MSSATSPAAGKQLLRIGDLARATGKTKSSAELQESHAENSDEPDMPAAAGAHG